MLNVLHTCKNLCRKNIPNAANKNSVLSKIVFLEHGFVSKTNPSTLVQFRCKWPRRNSYYLLLPWRKEVTSSSQDVWRQLSSHGRRSASPVPGTQQHLHHLLHRRPPAGRRLRARQAYLDVSEHLCLRVVPDTRVHDVQRPSLLVEEPCLHCKKDQHEQQASSTQMPYSADPKKKPQN